MITRSRIRQIISEAVGVPADMDMMTDILTNMVKVSIQHFKDTGEELETGEASVKNYGDVEYQQGEINISGEKSWSYVKKSPLFDEEKWMKFPMYKNKVSINFSIYPDEALDINNMNRPNINAAHEFDPTNFGPKQTKGVGMTYNSGGFEFNIIMGESNWDDLETLSPNLDATIAHEVFHSYQLYVKYNKTGKVGFGKEHNYNTMAGALKKDFSKELNYFLHVLYLSLRFEQQARIPQTLRVLKSKNIENYDDFMDELKKTDAYRDAEMLKTFSADKLINDLNQIQSFEDIFRKGIAKQHMEFAVGAWNDIIDKIVDHAKSSGISAEPFRGMSQKLLDNPRLFFKHWEKVFHKRGEELFRKLTRLHSAL